MRCWLSGFWGPQAPGLAPVKWLWLAYTWYSGAGALAAIPGSPRPVWVKVLAAALMVSAALLWRARPRNRVHGAALAVMLLAAMLTGTVAVANPVVTIGLLFGLGAIRSLLDTSWWAALRVGLTVTAFVSGAVLDAVLGGDGGQLSSALLSVPGMVVCCGSMQLLATALRGQAAARAGERAGSVRLAAVVDHSPAAIVMVDRDGALVTYNAAAEKMFGVSMETAQTNVEELVLRPTGEGAQSPLPLLYARALAGETLRDQPVSWVHPDGRSLQLSASLALVTLPDHGAAGVLAVINDVTEQQQMEALLRRQAFTDELTGLANRNLFTDRLEHALSARASRATLAVLLIDLDGFKAVNDTGGHPAGDLLLHETAARLQNAVRRGDTVSRLGGDEFAILLEATTPEGAAAAAEHLVRTLRTTVHLPTGEEIPMTGSIGVVVLPTSWQGDVDQVLADVDLAMYAAKRAGKNRWEAYDPMMRQEVAERLRLETELRTAVDQGQIVVHYQPYIDMSQNRIVGFEALARWAHPDRGLLAPAEFIALAEETGLIVPLGHQVLRQAAEQLRAWQLAFPAHPPLTISVNLSVRQLADPMLVGMVREVLADSGLSPRSLTLEITESLLAADDLEVVGILESLTQLGVRLAIDDFGTGFSALAYLQRFPVDVLKVDRSFVQEITGPEATPLTRSIIALAQSLHLETIAEGIENAEQAGALRDLGCVTAQGYYFARPQEPAQISELLGGALPGPTGRPDPPARAMRGAPSTSR